VARPKLLPSLLIADNFDVDCCDIDVDVEQTYHIGFHVEIHKGDNIIFISPQFETAIRRIGPDHGIRELHWGQLHPNR
jgi:hypothetical protein